MSASARRRVTAIRNTRTAPRPKPHMLGRLIVAGLFIFVLLLGGLGIAAFAFYNGVNYKFNPAVLLTRQNSILTDSSGRTVLYQSIDRTHANAGSRVLKPLELNARDPKQCPQGRKTKLNSFYYHLPTMTVQYLTCNGWGIPFSVQDATIATEDPTFYSNPGFDPLSIMRAAVQDLTSGQIQSGASTIAQQIAKQFVLHDASPTLSRKLKELVVAYRITQKYPKKFILYLYLNSVFYGQESYGVQAAAQTYFHRDVSKIKLWQAAMLAGMPQAPSAYDPFTATNLSALRAHQYPAWQTRMVEVLNYLQSRGYISKNKANLARNRATYYHWREPNVGLIKDADFVSFVTNQLQAMISPDNGPRVFDPYLAKHLGSRSLNDGLKIVTTLRPALQAMAQTDVNTQVASLTGELVTDGALVSINLKHHCLGCIIAMVGNGGADPKHALVNMADIPRQPGSSIKVFNYVSAFEKGLSPASRVLDAPIAIPDTNEPTGYYSPTNYIPTYNGNVSVRYALDNSLNVPAVKTEVWNGIGSVAHTAYKFGITDFWKDNPGCCKGIWATTLGGIPGGIRLWQETQAYGAFGRGGRRVYAISFSKIVDRATGKVLWKRSQDTWLKHQDSRRVAPADNVYQVSSILSDNETRAAEFYAPSLDPLALDDGTFNAAAKTGTTQNFKDNWTEGYTPQIVTGVWVGNADDAAMGYGVNGITGAAPIWHNFMLQAIQILHLQNLPFNPPSNMTTSANCLDLPYSGYTPALGPVVTDPDPQTGTDAATFIAGKDPYCQVPAVPGLDAATPSQTTPTVPQTQPTTPPPATGPGLLP